MWELQPPGLASHTDDPTPLTLSTQLVHVCSLAGLPPGRSASNARLSFSCRSTGSRKVVLRSGGSNGHTAVVLALPAVLGWGDTKRTRTALAAEPASLEEMTSSQHKPCAHLNLDWGSDSKYRETRVFKRIFTCCPCCGGNL